MPQLRWRTGASADPARGGAAEASGVEHENRQIHRLPASRSWLMAIYHLSIKTVGRSQGRSATAAAAYRSGEKIADLTSGQVFDYTRKRGVEHTEIVLPTKVVLQDINWARDRQALWNAAEVAEKRKDARVAREYELAIPHELAKTQRAELVREFSTYLADRYGVGVDFAIHKAHREGDQRNHHAHVLTTTRAVAATGLDAKTALELSETDRARRGMPHSRAEFVEIRERWAVLSNEHLKAHGHDARIDHRTLAMQGIDRPPTVHLGVAVTGLIRRGVESTVEKRVAWQELQVAVQRLGLAKEAGALERERQRVDAGVLGISTDVRAARRERDARRTIDRTQSKSREAWRIYRANQDLANSTSKVLSESGFLRTPDAIVQGKAKQEPSILVDRDRLGLER
jgi:ATP-dependent exoDNAse (exonuclease V) alpha subunit